MEFNHKKGWLVAALLFHAFIALTIGVSISSNFFLHGAIFGIHIDLAIIYPYLLVLSAVLGVVSLKVAIEIIKLLETETETQLHQTKIKNMEQINLVLREQRHDFLNHLQVVSGLFQLQKYDKAKEYLFNLSENLVVGNKEKLPLNSEVGILIYVKKLLGKRLQIDWQQQVDLDFDLLVMPGFDLVRVLGNIFDNALYELQQVPVSERKLTFMATQQAGQAEMSVTNYGSVLDNNIKNEVFEPGFTTKQNKGDGMGLYIVKSLVEKWEGTVKLSGNDEEKWTKITVTCPVKEPEGKKIK